MKIGVVTLFKNNHNYGAVLQVFALQSYLKSKGYVTEILDIYPLHYPQFNKSKAEPLFIRNYNRVLSKLKRMSSLEEIYWLINKYLNKHKFKLWCDSSQAQNSLSFEKFIKENILVSNLYNSENINSINDDYSFFITGSDQVWKPQCTCDEYFLSFVKDKNATMSYAASFGVDNLESEEEIYVKKMIANINYVSVRESDGVNILGSLGCNDVDHVVDPTMLMGYDYWNNLIDENPIVNEKYIFLYLLSPNLKFLKIINKKCDEYGLKLVAINGLLNNDLSTVYYCDELVGNVGPIEFLNLIKYSKYVLTDSFHGTVFSIILRKSFWVISRNNEGKNMNSRISSLLNDAHAEQRFLINYNDLTLINDDKSAEYYNMMVEKIEKSKTFLDNILLGGK